MSTKLPPTVNGIATVQLPCCACTGKVSFATPEATANPTFFHTMPYCMRFNTVNTAHEFVQYMRDCRVASERN